MIVKATTTTVLCIELTEAEAYNALVEPELVQAQIRAALKPVAEAKNGRKSIRLGGGKANGAAPKDDGRPSTRKKAAKSPCPTCGNLFAPQGLAKHLPTCRGDAQ